MVGNIQRKMPSREALGAFASALRRLVRTKTFEQISVRAIVKESGLSSRTFYNHFRSKYDLVFWRYAAEARAATSWTCARHVPPRRSRKGSRFAARTR